MFHKLESFEDLDARKAEFLERRHRAQYDPEISVEAVERAHKDEMTGFLEAENEARAHG